MSTLQDRREDLQFAGIRDCETALPVLTAADADLNALHTGLHRRVIAALNDEVTPGVVDQGEAALILASHREGCVGLKRRLASLVGFVGRQCDRFKGLNMIGCREAEHRPEPLRCCRCGEEKPDDEFPREVSKITRRGRGSLCIPCKALTNAEYGARQRSLREAAQSAQSGVREEAA